MTLTVVSLFAGIGGFDEAFRRAGADVVASVEIDKNCRAILARHFPESTIFDDVTKVSGDELRAAGFVSSRGVLCAGWPCQDLSVAGRGEGLSGQRSGLFFEVVRLLKELQPKWFVLENVPRLVTINGGRDMGTVTEALAECGYSFSWRVLDAQHFGVPQRRRRIFFVGCLGDSGEPSGQVLFEPEGVCGDSAEGLEAGPETARSATGRASVGSEPIAFHMTQHPISGPISPCLGANSAVGVTVPIEPVIKINTHTHTHTL